MTSSPLLVSCVIFDADNTLYFTKKASKLGYQALFQFLHSKTGVPLERLEEVHAQIVNKIKLDPNPSVRKREYSLQLLLQKFFKDTPQLLAESVEVFWEVVGKNLQPARGVKSLISDLHKEYKLVVASDEFQKALMLKLRVVLGGYDQFEMLVTPEVAKSMKPSRAYYDTIINEFSLLPRRVVMVGDSWVRDLEAAKEVGLRTVLVAETKEGEPDYWIKELDDLRGILSGV
ncbi:MAG: HAD family hydrolase [bacterium]